MEPHEIVITLENGENDVPRATLESIYMNIYEQESVLT